MDSFGVRQNEALREQIKKMMEDRLAFIVDKRCASFEDYLGKCEAVQALREVLEASETIHRKLYAEATGQQEIESPALNQPIQRPSTRKQERELYRS